MSKLLKPLPKKFYNRDPAIVAKALLGKLLVRNTEGAPLIGMITETEAYLPSGDEAAHGFKGPTKRNASLYKEGGHAYVHTMRQYALLDVVTEGKGVAGSVLIRAVVPVQGIDGVQNGPGKVGRAFGITCALDGIDMTDASSELYIANNTKDFTHEIIISTRIGISKAKELPLRFRLKI